MTAADAGSHVQRRTESLALLSGKGGSGKTIIGLSLARTLAMSGFSVLLVDLDIATHGATYFVEADLAGAKNFLSLHELLELSGPAEDRIFRTTAGFWMVPSSLHSYQEDIDGWLVGLSKWLEIMQGKFDYIIFDCQAGATILSEWAAANADRSLVVLEADPVSSASVKTLALEMNDVLGSNLTWQVFNKLSEDERAIYGRIASGTFFTNLPPMPFDWSVRAAFARLQIPDVSDDKTAFGLAVLRMLKTLFPSSTEKVEELEKHSVGDWYAEIQGELQDIERNRKLTAAKASAEEEKIASRMQSLRIAVGLGLIFSLFGVGVQLLSPEQGGGYTLLAALLVVVILSFILVMGQRVFERLGMVRVNKVQKAREVLRSLDKEAEQYRTLLATDPRFVEYGRGDHGV